MRAVMSWLVLSKALVKRLGPGKGSSAMEVAQSEIWERWEVRREVILEEVVVVVE
jgi:hypothetical protein